MSDHAIANAQAWYETITDQCRRLKDACGKDADPDQYETIREEILESPLSLEVRSGWCALGSELSPEEFCILLSTGGPALRIVGDLGLFNCPEHSRMEWQDWGTPWTEYRPACRGLLDSWAAQFYWGD